MDLVFGRSIFAVKKPFGKKKKKTVFKENKLQSILPMHKIWKKNRNWNVM